MIFCCISNLYYNGVKCFAAKEFIIPPSFLDNIYPRLGTAFVAFQLHILHDITIAERGLSADIPIKQFPLDTRILHQLQVVNSFVAHLWQT